MHVRKSTVGNFIGVILLPLLALCVSPQPVTAQQSLITLNKSNVPLSEAITLIEQQTNYSFFYTDEINTKEAVSINIQQGNLEATLSQMLSKSATSYRVIGTQIILYKVALANNTRLISNQTKKPAGNVEQVTKAVSTSNTPQTTNSRTQQERTINLRGVVRDTNGQPIPDATVMIKGTRQITSTNDFGNFSFSSIDPNATIVVSFIGYKMVESPINGRTTIELTLEADTQLLQDVVVTGYQTISRERATGSYSIATAEVLSKRPTSNIASALTGLVPGMATVTSTVDGQTRFLIRGQGTLQGQNDMDPLIVVDNMPIQGISSLSSSDPFNTINPNDVEKITVLKDAAATSIYGARAANGVIVITTKKGGASEKLQINVDGFVSVSSKPDLDYTFNMASTESTMWYLDNLRTYYNDWNSTSYNPYYNSSNPFIRLNEYAQYMFEYYNRGNITESEFNQKKAELIGRGDQWKKDLNKLVYRNAINQQYNVSLRGGTEKVSYSLSASFDKKSGYAIGNENNRIVINSMNRFKISNKLTFNFGLNVSLANDKKNGISLSTLQSSISPWSRLVDKEGNYVHLYGSPNGQNTIYEPIYKAQYEGKVPASWFYNPVLDRQEMDNTTELFTTRINAGMEYQVIESLKVHVSGQYERNQNKDHLDYSANSFYVRHYTNIYSTLNATSGMYSTYFPSGGIFRDNGAFYEGYVLRAQADFNKSFGKHDITAIAGTEVIQSTNENIPTTWRYGYNKNTNSVLSSLDYVNRYNNMFGALAYMPYTAPGGLQTLEDRFFSAYANAAYTYDSKYTVSGSVRTDASNYQAIKMRDKFSPFWSVGLSWIVSKEHFMENVPCIDFLKLRGSVGEAGLAAGKGGTASVTTVATGTPSVIYTNNEPYSTIASRGNPTLTWEKSRTMDIGLEFGLWKNKLNGNFTYYDKYSYDVLSEASVPLFSQGVSEATFNNAEISNKGVEISLGSRIKITKDFEWDGLLNFSYNKNKVLAYHVINTNPYPYYYPGYPVEGIWAYKLSGYTKEGVIVMEGKDGAQEIVTSTATAHFQDQLDGASGERVEDYNWSFFLGSRASTLPYHFGFKNSFSYKGFTLSVMLTGKFGYYFQKGGVNYHYYQNSASYSKSLDKAIEVYNIGYDKYEGFAGSPLHNEANKATLNANNLTGLYNTLMIRSTHYYAKGDHIRLNEVYLGYDLSGKQLGMQKVINGLNIFVQAKNLGVIWRANDEKIDPDYPLETLKPMPTFTFGLKINMN